MLWTYVPAAVDLFDRRSYRGLVYHCVDDLAAFPGVDGHAFERAERRLITEADVAIASSRPLERHLRRRGAKRVLYWPNPADTVAFTAAARPAPAGTEVRRIGFVGAIEGHKVDVRLIGALARRRPDWTFELVGPIGLGLGRTSIRAEDFPANVRLIGAVERSCLPARLSAWAAALVPYVVNAYTRSVFPMKVFEYLAAGLPTVSTPLPSLVGEVNEVTFADGLDGFERAITQELASDSSERRRERMAYASSHSWQARRDEALDLLTQL